MKNLLYDLTVVIIPFLELLGMNNSSSSSFGSYASECDSDLDLRIWDIVIPEIRCMIDIIINSVSVWNTISQSLTSFIFWLYTYMRLIVFPVMTSDFYRIRSRSDWIIFARHFSYCSRANIIVLMSWWLTRSIQRMITYFYYENFAS